VLTCGIWAYWGSSKECFVKMFPKSDPLFLRKLLYSGSVQKINEKPFNPETEPLNPRT